MTSSVVAFSALAVAPNPAGELGARPFTIALALALVGLLPFLFMTLTAFVKISTVLFITRSALGAPEVPSGTLVTALAFALTLVAMAPVGTKVADRLMPLFDEGDGRTTSAWVHDVVSAVREPLTGFLRANASPKETDRFYELLRKRAGSGPDAPARDDLRVVVPAFLVTELVEAFLLGFAIFLPFLVVDLVVANVVTALGLTSVNPERFSLPFKLLLFVAADGWGLLAQSLVTGYKPG